MAFGGTNSLFPYLRGCTEISRHVTGLPVKLLMCALHVRNWIKNPKDRSDASLAEVWMFSPCTSVPVIDSMWVSCILCYLGGQLWAKVSEMDGEVCFKVEFRKNKDAAQLPEISALGSRRASGGGRDFQRGLRQVALPLSKV